MTDRELLELAAKAAGIEIHHYNDLQNAWWIDSTDKWWNPLTDDGDALRLAVRLGIHITQESNCVRVLAYKSDMAQTDFVENFGSDPYAATRRAIVRAAAEIGRTE